MRILPLQAIIKVVCVAEDADSFDGRDRLSENFQSLLAQVDKVDRHACHVAAPSGAALDGPAAHEVARLSNHERNAGNRSPRRLCWWRHDRHDSVGSEPHKLDSE